MCRPPDGDRRMREWTRVTSLTQHDGLLFASIGSCTSAAADAPADIRGSVQAFGAGIVATTPRTLEPGRRHVAAVRRGSTLGVFVDGREAAFARGEMIGSVGTSAPLRVGEDESGRYAGTIDGFRVFDRALEPREIKTLQYEEVRDMKRWRVGMVGYGWAAGAHIGALDLIDRFEVAAICTSREDVDAAELERRHGRPDRDRPRRRRAARPARHRRDRHLQPQQSPRGPGDRRRARRQAPDHREADRARRSRACAPSRRPSPQRASAPASASRCASRRSSR